MDTSERERAAIRREGRATPRRNLAERLEALAAVVGNRRPRLQPAEASPSRSGLLVFMCLLASIALLGPGSARAQVTNTLDDVDDPPDGSLRSQVETGGPIVRFEIPSSDENSTIALDEVLSFDRDVTLDNSNRSFEIFPILAPEQGAFLIVEDDVDLILRDVALRGDSRNNDDEIDLQSDTSILTIDLSREDETITVDITGDGKLVKAGAQSLELTGENDFTGGIEIQQGDLIGDFDSIAADGVGTIDLRPNSTTARVVFDVSGTANSFGPNTPAITATESNGGNAVFVKDGSGSLDIGLAQIDPEIDLNVVRGDLIIGNANISAGHDISIGSSGTLSVQAVAPADLTGALSGSGTLEVDPGLLGFAALTISGNTSSFTGDIEILDGDLVAVLLDPASPPTSTLGFSVDLGTGSVFEIADDDDLTLSGDISGVGELFKTGTGTTRLTGRATHTGGTSVFGGILVGDTGNLQRDISVADGSEIHFDQASDGSFNGSVLEMGGTIVVKKFGAGTLTLGTSQDFAGRFDFEDGGLTFGSGVTLSNADLIVGDSDNTRATLSATFDSAGSQARQHGLARRRAHPERRRPPRRSPERQGRKWRARQAEHALRCRRRRPDR